MQWIEIKYEAAPQFVTPAYSHLSHMSNITFQSTHLDSMKLMVEVFKQHLHTTVVTVSHENAVLLFSAVFTWAREETKRLRSLSDVPPSETPEELKQFLLYNVLNHSWNHWHYCHYYYIIVIILECVMCNRNIVMIIIITLSLTFSAQY